MSKKDLSERDICTKFITPALAQSRWDVQGQIREQVYFTKGRIIVRGKLVTRGKATIRSTKANKETAQQTHCPCCPRQSGIAPTFNSVEAICQCRDPDNRGSSSCQPFAKHNSRDVDTQAASLVTMCVVAFENATR
jgi:hypothetical protein